MQSQDWRSVATYDDLNAVPLRGLAWEYLRRNRTYAREYRDAMRVPDDEPAETAARRWGLRFPGRPPGIGDPRARVLDTRSEPRGRRHPVRVGADRHPAHVVVAAF